MIMSPISTGELSPHIQKGDNDTFIEWDQNTPRGTVWTAVAHSAQALRPRQNTGLTGLAAPGPCQVEAPRAEAREHRLHWALLSARSLSPGKVRDKREGNPDSEGKVARSQGLQPSFGFSRQDRTSHGNSRFKSGPPLRPSNSIRPPPSCCSDSYTDPKRKTSFFRLNLVVRALFGVSD